jgi:glycosyltransferase involved in cell wall biosynthesis
VAPALRRDSRLAASLGRLARRDAYFAEQMTHALALVPLLVRERPDVVYFSDWALGGALGRWRALSGQRFRLLLSNGAPGPPPYDWTIDHVQQLTPRLHEIALDAGEPPERHTLLPLGIDVPAEPAARGGEERRTLRGRLGIPPDRRVVLSVAALNMWSKRLDYVIREIAALDERAHLVMLGEPEGETPAVLALAESLLGRGGYTARTVPPAEIGDWYRAADALVLGSLHEAFARVLPEALGRGLPVVAHDADWARHVTGGHARLADLSEPGALAALLPGAIAQAAPAGAHAFARERFSWESLAPRYAEMIERCARSRRVRFRRQR